MPRRKPHLARKLFLTANFIWVCSKCGLENVLSFLFKTGIQKSVCPRCDSKVRIEVRLGSSSWCWRLLS